MPYRTRRSRSTRYKKRRFRRGSTRRTFGRRVQRVVRSYAEKKRVTFSLLNNEFDQDGFRSILDRVAQGTGEDQRIGRTIQPWAITARLELINNVSPSANRETWTVFLVQDYQQVGDLHAQISEIISDVGTAAAPMGLLNIANKGRFKILRRWQGVLMAQTQDRSLQYLHFYYKFKGRKSIRYNGPLTTDIEANGLMLCFVGSNTGADNALFVTGNIRMWYTDV